MASAMVSHRSWVPPGYLFIRRASLVSWSSVHNCRAFLGTFSLEPVDDPLPTGMSPPLALLYVLSSYFGFCRYGKYVLVEKINMFHVISFDKKLAKWHDWIIRKKTWHTLERKKLQVLLRTQGSYSYYSDPGETWHRETTRRGPTGQVLEEIRLTTDSDDLRKAHV